jgi:hypothetical protein
LGEDVNTLDKSAYMVLEESARFAPGRFQHLVFLGVGFAAALA